MKKLIVCTLIASLPFFYLAGCVQGPARPATGQSMSAPGPDGLVQDQDADLPSLYFYLKARRLLNKEEVAQAEAALKTALEKDDDSSFLHREYIRILQKQKKNEQALEMAEKLVAKDPNNVDNLLVLARMKKGEDEDLTELFRQILELDPGNKETFLRLGKIYMDGEMDQEALALFTKMANVFPDYYVAHFYLGEAMLMTGKHDQAEAAFLKSLELEPELVEPRFRLVNIYRTRGAVKNQEKILKTYNDILEVEPGNDRAILELALFHYKNKNFKKSDPLFAQLGQEVKKNPRLVMTAVETFISKKRYEDATIVFSQLRKVDPANTNLNFFLGMSYEAMEIPDKAIEYYLKVTPDHPQYKKTILSIAFLYRDKGKTNEAVRFLEQHHKQSPADIDIISYLASFYEEENRYDTAMTLLQKALKDNPDNTTLLFKLGAIQDKAGLRQDCINTMKALIRVDPNHASALNYLGYTYAEMGILLDEALDLIKRALEIRPGDGYITDSLGWVYYKKQEYDQAVIYLEKAAEISKYETVIAAHLADAYVKTGQLEKALATYKRALENAEDDQEKEIREIKEKIKQLEGNGE